MKHLILFIILFYASACKKNIQSQPTSTENSKSYPFENYLGINIFEWNYVTVGSEHVINESKIETLKGFGGIRHYLDWTRIEPLEGVFTFAPSHEGNWNYDDMYRRTKEEGLTTLICLKTIPKWMIETYPASNRDHENAPAPYGADKSKPASYIAQARAGFQLAARYGSNTGIDKNLIKVNTGQRWPNDQPNEVKIGLDYVKYIECGNERDKWWKGEFAEQTPEQYAANLSAFYDGHLGTLGKDVGVKTADTSMKVVMTGLAVPDPNFVIRMIEWCKKNRGYKKDGSVNLCFDVVNYHIYPNDSEQNRHSKGTVGKAPELSLIGKFADDFLKMAKKYVPNMEVWMTETGYDLNQNTIQRAIPIGSKSAYITQADWNLRTALLYARYKLGRTMFFMLENVDMQSAVQFNSSGFINPDETPRPTWYYFKQVKTLLGKYHYVKTINSDPIVDIYRVGEKEMYVLTVPDEKGRTESYTLDLNSAKQAVIHTLNAEKVNMESEVLNTVNGKITITVTETPIFVERL
jgi:hypothetical protein